MKISLNWLKEHIDFSELDSETLAEKLTFIGVEVEEIIYQGHQYKNIVIGKILEIKKHPNANKLQICSVNLGILGTKQIICGAKNISIGDFVPVALIGAILPNKLLIKESKIRGIDSYGMICSKEELDLEKKSEGVYILPKNEVYELGMNFRDVDNIPDADVIFQLEITPNRPDLLSHLGIAREISALLNKELQKKYDYLNETIKSVEANTDEIILEKNTACLFYSALEINNIKIQNSPTWLTQKLKTIDINPKNNIVDITNFLMFEMGQPFHAFDKDLIEGRIVIRNALHNEKFTALDDIEYTLNENFTVIADEKKIIALAGIIGAKNSAINENTQNIIVECAYFTPDKIRQNSSKLNLKTDSSYRFERGTDPKQIKPAIYKISQIITKYFSGQSQHSIKTVGQSSNSPTIIEFDIKKAKKLIGAEISSGEMKNILKSFNIDIQEKKESILKCTIPSYRQDLTRHIDLVEEITKIYGLDRTTSSSYAFFSPKSKIDNQHDTDNIIKNLLVHNSIFEVQSLKFISHKLCNTSNLENYNDFVKIKNPLSEEYEFLRPSIIPNLITIAHKNFNNNSKSVKIFESGKIFLNINNKKIEKKSLAILISGEKITKNPHNQKSELFDFYDLSNAIASIVYPNKIKIEEIQKNKLPTDIIKCGQIIAQHQKKKIKIGKIAIFNHLIHSEYEFKHPIFIAELNLSNIISIKNTEKIHSQISKFPSISRDITINIPKKTNQSEVANFIDSICKNTPNFKNYQLIDSFSKDNENALTYSFNFQSLEKTLTSKEIDSNFKNIKNKILAHYPQ